MDTRFFDELLGLASDTLPRLDVRGLVVRGRGRHFSSGANVDDLRNAVADIKDKDRVRDGLSGNTAALTAIEGLPYPVVAAVDGACFGSGLELALACDFRIATKGALLGLPEVTFGLMPGCGGTVRLPEVVGLGKAMDMMLTGRFLTAEEALEAGLVDAVVPRRELAEASVRLLEGVSAV